MAPDQPSQPAPEGEAPPKRGRGRPPGSGMRKGQTKGDRALGPSERFRNEYPTLSRELIARVLVDSAVYGVTRTAERHDVSRRTIYRYRMQAAQDAELAAEVARRTIDAEQGWHHARLGFLRAGLAKLQYMVENATGDQMALVIEAVKTIGDLEIAREALGVGSVGADQQGETPAANARKLVAVADDRSAVPDPGSGESRSVA